MHTSKAKYYDGRSASSVEVDLTFEGQNLRIERQGETIGRWPGEMIYRDPTHITAVVIGCSLGPERLEVLSPDFLKPLNLSRSTHSRADFAKYRIPGVLFLLALIALVSLGFYHSRIATKYLAQKISPSLEKKMLALIEAQGEKDYCKLSSSQEAALAKVTGRLFSEDPDLLKDVQIRFLKASTKNAFTLPGGAIWVFDPLLEEMESPDELAGVLAHEIEHVRHRHVVESLVRAGLFTGALNLLFGDVSGGFVLLDPATAAQVFSLKLSRDMESEADQGARIRMKAGEISPKGMRAFFSRLAKEDPTKGMAFLSSHPESGEREKLFQEEKGAVYRPLLNKKEWEDLKSACAHNVDRGHW